MDPTARDDVDVLVVGAGPTGLMLAVWLIRLGVRIIVVDGTSMVPETGGGTQHVFGESLRRAEKCRSPCAFRPSRARRGRARAGWRCC